MFYKNKETIEQHTNHQFEDVKKEVVCKKRIFVIHRHKSSILHYDLRLEVNGVLKSWVVPKGPSMNAHDKRVAVMIDDYPKAEASLTGIIPEGNFGGGIFEVWDRGMFVPLANADPHFAEHEIINSIESGRLKFVLRGRKLKGVFSLVRLNDSFTTWLLIKGNDKFAVDHVYNSEDYIPANSLINKAIRSGSAF